MTKPSVPVSDYYEYWSLPVTRTCGLYTINMVETRREDGFVSTENTSPWTHWTTSTGRQVPRGKIWTGRNTSTRYSNSNDNGNGRFVAN